VRLREILFALGTSYAIVTVTARTAPCGAVGTLAALRLPLHALLTLMAILTLLAVLAISALMRGPMWSPRQMSRIRCRRRRCRNFGGRACRRCTGFAGCGGLRPRTVRAARPLRAALGAPGRTPDLDEGRPLGRLAFGRRGGSCRNAVARPGGYNNRRFLHR
jgi:hypothetical protein